jgi:hypothetical protein
MPRTITNKRDAYLSAIRQVGDSDLARGYSGISKEELSQVPQDQIVEARAAFDKNRLEDAVELRKRARDFALLTEDPKAMLLVADHLAPELGIYGAEKARAKAKAEHAQPVFALQINTGMAHLAEKLQEALKGDR